MDKNLLLAVTEWNIIGLYVTFILIGGLVCGSIFGVLCQNLFRAKGHEGGFWLGFFLGIIGLIYAAGLPVAETPEASKYGNLPRDGKYVFCKNCGLLMPKEQTTCSNCGASLIEEIEEDAPKSAPYVLCPNCGFPVYDDEEKCSNCGTKREEITTDTRSDENR